MEEFKSNSYKSKGENEKKIEPIAIGKVRTKKKGELQRLAEIFIPEGLDEFKRRVVFDMIIPAVRDNLYDIIGMVMYQGEKPKKSTSRPAAEKTSYGRYYDSKNRRDSTGPRKKKTYDYDEVMFDTRGEAEEVLDGMIDYLETYDFVSVAVLYELSGVSSEYTDNKYGWEDLRLAKITRDSDGVYYIKLPKPRALD